MYIPFSIFFNLRIDPYLPFNTFSFLFLPHYSESFIKKNNKWLSSVASIHTLPPLEPDMQSQLNEAKYYPHAQNEV